MVLKADGEAKKEFQAPLLKEKDCVVKIYLGPGAKVKYIEKEASPQKAMKEFSGKKDSNLQGKLDQKTKLHQQELDDHNFTKKDLKLTKNELKKAQDKIS